MRQRLPDVGHAGGAEGIRKPFPRVFVQAVGGLHSNKVEKRAVSDDAERPTADYVELRQRSPANLARVGAAAVRARQPSGYALDAAATMVALPKLSSPP